jgi:hypothetical protein
MNLVFTPEVGSEFYARQHRELIAGKLLQVLDSLNINEMMISDRNEVEASCYPRN